MTTEARGYLYGWRGNAPPLLPAIGRELQQTGLLPAEASWWFGWHELAIQLPGRLVDLHALPATWDVIHLFSPHIELRWVERGGKHQVVLLTEQPLPSSLSAWHLSTPTPYHVRRTTRILWGNRLQLLGEETRAVVQFPRQLQYDLPDEGANLDHPIRAEVWAYYDAEARLQTIRYARLYHDAAGGPNQQAQ